MKQLVNTTVEDVNTKENCGHDVVIGVLDRQIETQVNWSDIAELDTIGIDEIDLRKGRKNYAEIVTARQKNEKKPSAGNAPR